MRKSFSKKSELSFTVHILAESLDSVSELPKSVNQQLQHLAKSRPKRTKTRAPSRTHVRAHDEIDASGALDTFFRTGSSTPSTTTPLISPNSDDRWIYFLWSVRPGLVHQFQNEYFCSESETLHFSLKCGPWAFRNLCCYSSTNVLSSWTCLLYLD